MSTIDWRKDACKSMWFLSDLERKNRGAKLTPEERESVERTLKEYVARFVRMATQKNIGQRGNSRDLDTMNTLEITGMQIIIAATDLALDGAFGEMPDRIEGDEYVYH